MADASDRIATLDLIRGVAVLGILAVNIAVFAGPPAAAVTPHIPRPAGFADELVFAGIFILFEGKMRALFTMLFGASMMLFIDRMEAQGRDGDLLQLRRLCWLMLFGLAHFFLLWTGDILFLYAAVGIIALFMREMSVKALTAAALIMLLGWHVGAGASELGRTVAEERVRIGLASPAETEAHSDYLARFHAKARDDLAHSQAGLAEQVVVRLRERTTYPVEAVVTNIGETLPLILIGMALYRGGFFTGAWSGRRLRFAAALGIGTGGAMTLAMLAWLWQRHFPPAASYGALLYWTAIPHLLMAIGYAATLVLTAHRLSETRAGVLLGLAGRMAFSNYVGTSIVMTAIFHGWGLNLAGRLGQATLLPFIALGCTLMVFGSAAWLARFRQGPLEWLWRCLTESRLLPNRR